VTRYTVFGKATKCPNCHAYLSGQPGTQGRLRCEYCGVEVEVAEPQERRPPTSPPTPPVVVRAPDPTVLVRAPKIRTWPYFLVAPLMTGGILYYSYFMQRQAMDRSTAATEEAQTRAAAAQRESQARARAAVDDAPKQREVTELAGPVARKGKIDPICHLSVMELHQTLDAETPVVAACFEGAPKKVKKVVADVKLVVEPSGAVSDADFEWDGWKPDAKMRKCAARKVRDWKMAKPSGDLATRCQVHLAVDPHQP
jgi:hypothetical protein